MRRVFALLLAITLWLGFAPTASASEVSNLLVPCQDSAAFQQRAKTAIPGSSAGDRFQKIVDAGMLCGKEDGLPRIIADGRLSRAGDFIIPSLLFLYLAGWLGWAGRNYLNKVRFSDTPEYREIMIDVPLAIQCFATALLWPVQALKEITTGEIQEPDDRVPVSFR